MKNELEKKMEALELDLRNEIEQKQDLSVLGMMRKELGELGGAGHYFGNDKGRVRKWMGEKEVKKVLQLLSLGEKKINLKEKGVSSFFE